MLPVLPEIEKVKMRTHDGENRCAFFDYRFGKDKSCAGG